MTAPRLLVVTHIAASAGLLGADLGLLALGLDGLTGADATETYPAMHTIAAWLLRPLALLALITGLAAALHGGTLRQTWVVAKLCVTLALTTLVVLVAEPGLAEAAAGAVTDGTRTTYGLVPIATAILLLLNITLAVYRPQRARVP